MIIDIATAISKLRPGAEYTLSDNDFATLNWLDQHQAPPTLAEVEVKLQELQQQAPINEIRAKRAAAYAAESDPIFFKAQRGEATMDDWRTAVAAIQLSFPYPTE